MNGYNLMSNSWEKLAAEGKVSKEDAAKHCRIYDFLSECDKEDINILIDSGAFNDIIKGYIKIAFNTADVPEKAGELMGSIFELTNAKSALEAFKA